MRIQPDRLKPILRVEFVLIVCILSAQLFTPHARGQAQDTDKAPERPLSKVQTTVEIGGQVRDIQGDHPAKFQEARDVPKGFFLQRFKLDYNPADSPYSLSLRGFEVRERDQRFSLDVGRVGIFRTKFVWDQIPHYFGDGQSFLVRTAPGFYQVRPDLRAQLQALTTPEARIPPNSVVSNLLRQELARSPITQSRLQRSQALFRQTYQPTENVELYFQFSWLRNRGTRPMAVGTFVRRAVPGPGGVPADIGGAWEGMGQEFLEPIDYRTISLKLGAQFGGKRWNAGESNEKRWSAGVEYELSLFRNPIGSVIFENPFRVTDDQGVGAANRYRSVLWQNALPPTNDAHTISFWAKLDLTSRTQVRAFFSLAYWTQNERFLPWTLNTAIVPRFWDPASPVNKPTDVNELSASSLNGKMRDINQEYALVNRRQNFRFQAVYRSRYLDSQTRVLEFPGYAAFGDSTWRSPGTDFYNLPIENLDWDFRRQNVEAGFRWDIRPSLTWRLDYEWEGWNRKERDVNRNNEHSIRNRLELVFNLSGGKLTEAQLNRGTTQEIAPISVTTLRLKLDYRYANRKALAYNTQPLSFNPNFPGSPPGGNTTAWEVTRFTQFLRGVPIEFNLLRRFDEANRIRNDASLTLELLKGPKTSFSASYRYFGDEYDKNFYGLLYNRFSFVDAEFSHAFDNGTFLYANYSRVTNRYQYRDLAHLLPNPVAPPGAIVQGTIAQYPIANTWERKSRNNLDSFEIGLNAAPQEGRWRKWQFDLAYAFSFTRDRITTANPFTVRPDSIVHAGAFPYPDTVVRRQYVNVAVTRRINERFEMGVRYWYEPYKQDDFSFNNQKPYMHGELASDTPKYLFQDARYGNYNSSIASVFVRFRF